MSTYDLRRSSIRSGDLLLFREHTFWSWLIRHVTGSDYCHVALAWVIGGRVMLLECRQASGVSVRMLSEALPCDWIATNCEWTDEIEEAALARLQTRYSILDAIRVGLGWRPSKSGEVCSLFAAETLGPWLAKSGITLDRKALTPGHLAEIFINAGCDLRALN